MVSEKVTKRVGSLIMVRPGYKERYIILHKHVFPGVLDRIRKSNIRNYSIFLLSNILFSYLEYVGNDCDADMEALADSTTKEWWKLTDPMQEPFPSRKTVEWWTTMNSIEYLGENTKPYNEAERYAYTTNIKAGSEKGVKKLFANFNGNFCSLFRRAYIQNHNVFLKDVSLYIYFEYSGNNFSKDNKELNNVPELKKWNTELEQHLTETWKQLMEVFHSD